MTADVSTAMNNDHTDNDVDDGLADSMKYSDYTSTPSLPSMPMRTKHSRMEIPQSHADMPMLTHRHYR